MQNIKFSLEYQELLKLAEQRQPIPFILAKLFILRKDLLLDISLSNQGIIAKKFNINPVKFSSIVLLVKELEKVELNK